MSAAAPSVKAGTSTRGFNVAVLALVLAMAALVLVAIGQASTTRQAAVPAVAPAPAVHDHGWSSATDPYRGMLRRTPASTRSVSGPARQPSTLVTPDGIRIQGERGGLLYNGIPYGSFEVAPGGAGGSIRGRLAQ